jgi:hypothetical protein
VWGEGERALGERGTLRVCLAWPCAGVRLQKQHKKPPVISIPLWAYAAQAHKFQQLHVCGDAQMGHARAYHVAYLPVAIRCFRHWGVAGAGWACSITHSILLTGAGSRPAAEQQAVTCRVRVCHWRIACHKLRICAAPSLLSRQCTTGGRWGCHAMLCCVLLCCRSF